MLKYPKRTTIKDINTTVLHNCSICHASISEKICLACQQAINLGIVPESVRTDRDSWYSAYEVVGKFKISSSVMSKMLKEGKLKSRKIKALSGSTSFEIFLKHENEILNTFRLH